MPTVRQLCAGAAKPREERRQLFDLPPIRFHLFVSLVLTFKGQPPGPILAEALNSYVLSIVPLVAGAR